MTAQESLLPCPFCGDTPKMSKHFRYDAWNLIHRCKAIGVISFEFTESKESIVSRWNRRQPVARTPLSVQKIRQIDAHSGLNAIEFVRAVEAARGITQEKQG